jgi:hypothetical protein
MTQALKYYLKNLHSSHITPIIDTIQDKAKENASLARELEYNRQEALSANKKVIVLQNDKQC